MLKDIDLLIGIDENGEEISLYDPVMSDLNLYAKYEMINVSVNL